MNPLTSMLLTIVWFNELYLALNVLNVKIKNVFWDDIPNLKWKDRIGNVIFCWVLTKSLFLTTGVRQNLLFSSQRIWVPWKSSGKYLHILLTLRSINYLIISTESIMQNSPGVVTPLHLIREFWFKKLLFSQCGIVTLILIKMNCL